MEIEERHTFSFFLVPGFSLVAISSAVDALRSANVEFGKPIFQWNLCAEGNGAIISSSGISLECQSFGSISTKSIIAVVGGERTHLYNSEAVNSWLKQCDRNGANIGSISDGAYLLAAIGLFDNSRSTIHWKCQNGYRELYPELDVRTSILEIDGRRFSCAGGTASLDLMLYFIDKYCGPQIAGRVADNYFHDTIRSDGEAQPAVQPMTSAFRFASRDKTLSNALMIMESNIESPIAIGAIASKVQSSHRQLDRLFHRYLDSTPAGHYRELRIARAAGLLRQTGLSVGEIALACGFQNGSHLSKYFARKFGSSPHRYRRDH